MRSSDCLIRSSDCWLFFPNSDRLFFQSSDRWLFFLNSDRLIFFLSGDRLDRVKCSDIVRNRCGRRLHTQNDFIIIVLWIGAAVSGQVGAGGCSWRGVGARWGVRQLAQAIQFTSALDCTKNEKLAPFRMLALLDHRDTHACHIRHQLRVRPVRRSECQGKKDDDEEDAPSWEDPSDPQHSLCITESAKMPKQCSLDSYYFSAGRAFRPCLLRGSQGRALAVRRRPDKNFRFRPDGKRAPTPASAPRGTIVSPRLHYSRWKIAVTIAVKASATHVIYLSIVRL